MSKSTNFPFHPPPATIQPMKIILVPHKTLRKTATPITKIDKKITSFLKELTNTLDQSRNPKGAGLAANQVDKLYRAFATNIPLPGENTPTMRTFINPKLVGTKGDQEIANEKKDGWMEGCLSIPKLYGPVPRWNTVTLEFQILENDELVTKTETFTDFAASLMQHELDHLDGVLFTDYSLKYDLPLFAENPQTNKMEEIDKSIVEAW